MTVSADRAGASAPGLRSAPAYGQAESRFIGYRAVITVTASLIRPPVVSDVMHLFWAAIEAGAQELWIDLSGVAEIDEAAARMIERLSVSTHELERRLAVIHPDHRRLDVMSPAHVETYASRSEAQLGRSHTTRPDPARGRGDIPRPPWSALALPPPAKQRPSGDSDMRPCTYRQRESVPPRGQH